MFFASGSTTTTRGVAVGVRLGPGVDVAGAVVAAALAVGAPFGLGETMTTMSPGRTTAGVRMDDAAAEGVGHAEPVATTIRVPGSTKTTSGVVPGLAVAPEVTWTWNRSPGWPWMTGAGSTKDERAACAPTSRRKSLSTTTGEEEGKRE